MGYSTGFAGSFRTNRVVDEEMYRLLHGLATTRRIKRELPKTFGVDGEFYIQDDERGVVNKNRPPRSQPSLWCGWLIQSDRRTIQWDGHEKFQEYIQWLIYLIRLLRRRGYTLSGNVAWQGETIPDAGVLHLTPTRLRITSIGEDCRLHTRILSLTN